MMNNDTAQRLLELNRAFYANNAHDFARTRQSPQPGFERLLAYLPANPVVALDIGCGNGRFGRFLLEHLQDVDYTGIDFTPAFLTMAREAVPGTFFMRDIHSAGFLDELGGFDLIVCLATVQHIPGIANRKNLLQEMARHLAPGGRIFLSNWQFAHSQRQKRKILEWQEVGIKAEDLEENDYLLSWQRNGRDVRYVHLVTSEEIVYLSGEASLEIIEEFRSDGREGNLNLYSVLGHPG